MKTIVLLVLKAWGQNDDLTVVTNRFAEGTEQFGLYVLREGGFCPREIHARQVPAASQQNWLVVTRDARRMIPEVTKCADFHGFRRLVILSSGRAAQRPPSWGIGSRDRRRCLGADVITAVTVRNCPGVKTALGAAGRNG